jgi:hypothetical protein
MSKWTLLKVLPSSQGYTVLMVVVDQLTKYTHSVALKHPFTAAVVAKTFIANVLRLCGIPSSIVSDRGNVFISSFLRTLFRLQGTKLCMSSSHHPQSDGQTEGVNRTLEQCLCCFAGGQPQKWLEWILWAEFSYNKYIHPSTKMTPFEVVYGIPPPDLLAYVPGTSHVQAVDKYLRDRDAILRELHHNLILAQNRMKCQAESADHHRREISYVYLRLQSYRKTSVAFQSSMKLAPFFWSL